MSELCYNTSIKSLLASVASLDHQVGPVELCCMWFDDIYRPADKNQEQYAPGVWERGLREWRACFTDAELTVLAEFHAVFDAESDGLSMEWPDWDKDPAWRRVRDAARAALAKLGQIDVASP